MNGPPVSLSQFVLKVNSRCNLACDHCYVYEAADQSWRGCLTAIKVVISIGGDRAANDRHRRQAGGAR